MAPTEAARRGYSGNISLCKPDGAGGYTRISVSVAVAQAYQDSGYLPDSGCCADTDCGGDSCSSGICDPVLGECLLVPVADGAECTPNGPINLCAVPYSCQAGVCTGASYACPGVFGGCTKSLGCNPTTGECEYGPADDGSACPRFNGDTRCINGTCQDGICLDPPVEDCGGDLCNPRVYDSCNGGCISYAVRCDFDPECRTGYCDPERGCVFTNINEYGPCGAGGAGTCLGGVCNFM
ncbi:MAG TPA: hypothetical protein VFP05_12385 [Thermomicrobiales bacterium]|nr:hypothetical protein [Thermomicrobiales bacterium]